MCVCEIMFPCVCVCAAVTVQPNGFECQTVCDVRAASTGRSFLQKSPMYVSFIGSRLTKDVL